MLPLGTRMTTWSSATPSSDNGRSQVLKAGSPSSARSRPRTRFHCSSMSRFNTSAVAVMRILPRPGATRRRSGLRQAVGRSDGEARKRRRARSPRRPRIGGTWRAPVARFRLSRLPFRHRPAARSAMRGRHVGRLGDRSRTHSSRDGGRASPAIGTSRSASSDIADDRGRASPVPCACRHPTSGRPPGDGAHAQTIHMFPVGGRPDPRGARTAGSKQDSRGYFIRPDNGDGGQTATTSWQPVVPDAIPSGRRCWHATPVCRRPS